jgi:DNA excision repair protein ERCC-2
MHPECRPSRSSAALQARSGIVPDNEASQMKYTAAIRSLCEFTAREGDLDLRFTPAPSAQEGIAGHTAIADRRPAHYQAEVALEGAFGELRVRGRADGYDPLKNQLEEFKTYRGSLDNIPENHRVLHRAQLKMYGHLLCQKLDLPEVSLCLVYFDIGTQKETHFPELHPASALKLFFEDHCARFLQWAQRELTHREARDTALAAMQFPHAEFRPGQRPLAEAVYKAASSGRCLLAQAPTGIGKSIGTLFPLLKACPSQGIDKVFYLAAKTPGRRLALDAAALVSPQSGFGAGVKSAPIRVLELVARDKACEHPDKACHGASCPLAKGFYDRLPAARDAAVESGGMLDQASLRAVALAHQVCPYYLSQDLVRWSDVVVADYNYYFDLHAMLYALTVQNEWRVGVLVDEAHNLIERGRKMYTATLDHVAFRVAYKAAPAAMKKVLRRVEKEWGALHAEQRPVYQVASAPLKFLLALQGAVSAMSEAIAASLTGQPEGFDGPLGAFYLDALHFSRLGELFGEHSLFDITLHAPRLGAPVGVPSSILCIRNVVPAPFLKPRFAAARSVTLFSATLSPWHFYSDVLGLPEDTPFVDVASPFSAEQLSVRVTRNISTRFQHREMSLSRMTDLLARQYEHTPGNYLAFFSSFDYLQKAVDAFGRRHPAIPVRSQERGMAESERNAFLAAFTRDSRGIAFAVLGGAFAEGIDLPGERLIGAFIATLGLPQFDAVNEEIRRRMDSAFGTGYEYTYLYPGLQKVVQAAGRVIRASSDVGTIHLIDDRFAQREVLALLPAWWKVEIGAAAL